MTNNTIKKKMSQKGEARLKFLHERSCLNGGGPRVHLGRAAVGVALCVFIWGGQHWDVDTQTHARARARARTHTHIHARARTHTRAHTRTSGGIAKAAKAGMPTEVEWAGVPKCYRCDDIALAHSLNILELMWRERNHSKKSVPKCYRCDDIALAHSNKDCNEARLPRFPKGRGDGFVRRELVENTDPES
ncbi:hypothetical protein T492DRAFT_845478 [Pavlovales sp. CCMP2436]|nr:hypothetical protein T492DRAFT_845478 [Pavlovales sp. CCMP2436]